MDQIMDKSKTLEELEGDVWGDPEFDSALVQTCHGLRKKPLAKFTVEDLRVMILQHESLESLVPLALEVLEVDPLAAGDYCPGDLLHAVATLPRTFWRDQPQWGNGIKVVVEGVRFADDSTSILKSALDKFLEMMEPETGADMRRSDQDPLGFIRATEMAFRFLIDDYGFRLVSSDSSVVRYESESVYVHVWFESYSFELYFALGLLANPNDSYSSTDLIDFASESDMPETSCFQVTTSGGMVRLTQRLADFLVKNGESALQGNTAFYDRVAKVRKQKSNTVTRSLELADARRDADAAWRKRDHPKVVDALEKVGNDLTPAEAKKLDYAKKRNWMR